MDIHNIVSYSDLFLIKPIIDIITNHNDDPKHLINTSHNAILNKYNNLYEGIEFILKKYN